MNVVLSTRNKKVFFSFACVCARVCVVFYEKNNFFSASVLVFFFFIFIFF